MSPPNRPQSEQAILIVFGDLTGPAGKIRGEDILKELFQQHAWLTPRFPATIGLPINALFYQSRVGIVARAIVSRWREAGSSSTPVVTGLPTNQFTKVLDLEAMDIMKRPISIGPLAQQLEFVTTKTNWGHALRFSPRLISQRDYETITRAELAEP